MPLDHIGFENKIEGFHSIIKIIYLVLLKCKVSATTVQFGRFVITIGPKGLIFSPKFIFERKQKNNLDEYSAS